MSTSVQIYNLQFLGLLDSAYILRVALAISYGSELNSELRILFDIIHVQLIETNSVGSLLL